MKNIRRRDLFEITGDGGSRVILPRRIVFCLRFPALDLKSKINFGNF